jgi:hypothetical protein
VDELHDDALMPDPGPQTIPITFAPGVVRSSTAAGVGAQWYDSHLMRWVLGRMRPITGWETLDLPAFPSKIRAMHVWVDQNSVERLGILCEEHMFVLEGPDVPGAGDQLRDVTPVGGIVGPSNTLLTGGYGNDPYGRSPIAIPPFPPNTYGTPRGPRPDRRRIGEIWRLANWGEDLVAMASSDGRLLRWIPGPDLPEGNNVAKVVPNAPIGNRTFIVTAERHVMLFAMDGNSNMFGWCSQENIEDWDFSSVEYTAGFYSIEPASRIICAMAAQYSIIFWTVQGAYVVQYKALPYIYTYSYLGQHTAPLSGQAPVAYSGTVMWPAADGFWRFDGSQVQPVVCPILDWFQETYDEKATRAFMAGWFNGANSEIWWCFPRKPTGSEPAAHENDTLIVFNFQEKWWSIGKLKRTCGVPGSILGYPLMAATDKIYRHERGHVYPDCPELPWIRSGFVGVENGTVMATTRQILVDTDAELDAVSYQLFATKGRYKDAPERTKGPKTPKLRQTLNGFRHNEQGKIDYRISGRDFAVKMQMLGSKDWSFGQGQVVVTPRGKRGGP